MEKIIEACERGQVTFKNFSMTYNNAASAKEKIQEIADHSPYFFTSEKIHPLIIDAGSGIGISTLYFKSLFPQARIICFEPDPNAFELLDSNINSNRINNVELLNYAVSQQNGEVDFFGKFFSEAPDNSGSSMIEAWGCQYKENDSTVVTSVKLSSYVNAEIDFLKLDVGGCEQQILEELETEKKLSLIKQVAIEMHQAHKIKTINSIPKIYSILRKNNFEVTITEKDSTILLSKATKEWARRLRPQLFLIKASKINTRTETKLT